MNDHATDTPAPDEGTDAKAAKRAAREDRRLANLESRLAASVAAREATEAKLAATRAEIDALAGRGSNDADGKRWAELEDENNALREEIASVEFSRNHKALLSAVAEVADADPFLVSAALRAIHEEDPSVDIAPPVDSAVAVRRAIRALQEHAPSLFRVNDGGGKARARPGPAPTPHLGGVWQGDETDAEMWARRGAAADPLADLKRLRQPGRRFG